MPTYTVHQPPPRHGEAASAPERFVFARDGFHFWAFVLTPFWLLRYRLWLAFTIYLAVSILLGLALRLTGASSIVQFLAGVLVALLIGFEAATLRRTKLARRGWKTLGFVVAGDAEMAEQRFFSEWAKRPQPDAARPPALVEPPTFVRPSGHEPPAGNPIIGLFPEPGAPR